MFIGDRIRRYRRTRDWSQGELAKRANITIGYLRRVEIGRYPQPAISSLARIARALGVSVEQLYREHLSVCTSTSNRARSIAS